MEKNIVEIALTTDHWLSDHLMLGVFEGAMLKFSREFTNVGCEKLYDSASTFDKSEGAGSVC